MDLSGLKRNWQYYAAILVLIIIILMKQNGYADYRTSIQYEKRIFNYSKVIGLDQCFTNAQKRDFYKYHGDRCLNDARQKCWYYPKLTERRKMEYSFSAMATLAAPGTPQSKLISTLLVTLVNFGVDAWSEWDEMKTKLNWSEYHYGMMEFHQHLITQGYP